MRRSKLSWTRNPRKSIYLMFGIGGLLSMLEKDVFSQSAVVSSEFIFGQAPFESCHASTIVETESGLLVAWFGGTREGDKDVEIWMSRLEQGKWSAPRSIANGIQEDSSRYPCWNPVLVGFPDSSIGLFYKVGPNPRAWWGEYLISFDEGNTWSQPVKLAQGILGPIKNKFLVLREDIIISPSSTEDDGWRIHFEWSGDGGNTWEIHLPPYEDQSIEGIQPTLFNHGDGKLQAVCRTKNGFLAETWSYDQGTTWSDLAAMPLPNPNSGIDGVTLRDGRHVLIYNHSVKPENKWGGLRSPLNVAISEDGKSWEMCLILESEPGEYSYPAVIQSSDSKLHITYTWNREKIKHLVLEPSSLKCETLPEKKTGIYRE